MERLIPRYKWGDVSPRETNLQRGSTYQFYRIVPTDVMVISAIHRMKMAMFAAFDLPRILWKYINRGNM